MIKGFKEFILRGNVIDLAVAVVIGAAFTAVVNAIVSSIINPLIELVWKPDEDGVVGITVNGLHGQVTFPISDLINAVIAFLAVAIVVYFVFVHPMNVMKERAARKQGVPEEPEPLPSEAELLVQIRDLLGKQADAAPKP
ncbi:large conductance mechanosensitive channel [Microbacterium terrae]|uniref:Large-conductance mechanosensitive channel n=1 Tax=Microbacterium terrae TaxID=69369 RepID=A0A0M2HE39_9MICO|nr:large conductance mechanosensitive channel protein MscL [Microbacterium terrae]KJL44904.1 Large-conductance mechanosensitive channel [Microbacterium terrae]MBP1076760.1 large conductance mechanosensitive channel [Microbacterium terrae]GLJ97591.1 large conductance mechanosensitive channel protein MscL [Microbacterium terrae]